MIGGDSGLGRDRPSMVVITCGSGQVLEAGEVIPYIMDHANDDSVNSQVSKSEVQELPQIFLVNGRLRSPNTLNATHHVVIRQAQF